MRNLPIFLLTGKRYLWYAFFVLLGLCPASFSLAVGAEAKVELEFTRSDYAFLFLSLAFALIALGVGAFLARWALRQPPGDERMQEVSAAIKEGALAYLKRQVKTMSVFVLILAVGLFALFHGRFEGLTLYGIPAAAWLAFSFVLGVAASYIAGYTGMIMAVNANARVANAALGSYKRALEIAFRAGAVAGLITVGMGLLGATLIFLIAGAQAMKLLIGFGFGGSLAALFMRVGGGIYTKAADVGADLVGKVEAGIPEDDPRNAATIADNVGDNVGDCAGMAADVFESYEVTLVAAIVLGAATAAVLPLNLWMKLILFALMARGVGILASILGVFFVRGRDDERLDPMVPIKRGFWASAVTAIILTFGVAYWMMQDINVTYYRDAGGKVHSGIKEVDPNELRLIGLISQIELVEKMNAEQRRRQRQLTPPPQPPREQPGEGAGKSSQPNPQPGQEQGAPPQEGASGELTDEQLAKRVQEALKTNAERLKSFEPEMSLPKVTPEKIAKLRHHPLKEYVYLQGNVPVRRVAHLLMEQEMFSGPFLLVKVKQPPLFGTPDAKERETWRLVTKASVTQGSLTPLDQVPLSVGVNTRGELFWIAKKGDLDAEALLAVPALDYATTAEGLAETGDLSQMRPREPEGRMIAVAEQKREVAWWLFAVAITFGVVMALLIEMLTGYFVGFEKRPVREVAAASTAGPAPMIIQGFAYAMESSVWSVLAIVVCLLAPLFLFPPNEYGGFILSFYGIALVGLGLLTTTGFILGMDTFGPISDNAQGVYEMSGARQKEASVQGAMPPGRAVQMLDAAGNTTKALTKGFAIATAVVAAVALYHSYIEETQLPGIGLPLDLPQIFIGLLVGGAAPFLFSAFAVNAVGRAGFELIGEVRRQFQADPGILAGTSKPNYGRCVEIVTAAAQKELLGPGILAIALPTLVAFGLAIGQEPVSIGGVRLNLAGAQALGGFLAGAILASQLLAVTLFNAGGIWDNAKKTIEDGMYGGKGSPAHKAGVVCDTVGDPFKDTAGPALNPLIKVMNLVAVLLAPVIILDMADWIRGVVVAGCVVALGVAVYWSKRGSLGTELARAGREEEHTVRTL
jgi:K(+)-stimulated pyrophosphate-energized sodium pump